MNLEGGDHGNVQPTVLTKKNTGGCVVNNSGSTLESWWKPLRVSSGGITSEHKPEEPALEPECGTLPQDSKDAPGWRACQRPGAALCTPPQSFQAVPAPRSHCSTCPQASLQPRPSAPTVPIPLPGIYSPLLRGRDSFPSLPPGL